MNLFYQTFIEGCSTRSLRDNKSVGHLRQSPFVITKYDRIAECRRKSMLTLPLDTRVTIWLLLIDIHCKSIGYVLPIYESWSSWLCADLNTGNV